MRRLIVAAAVAIAVAGCNNRLPHPPYVAQPTAALVEVLFPPPPPRAEAVPPKPANDAVWIDGEWQWRGKKWAWSPGMWAIAPPGSSYSPWTSVRDNEGTLYLAPGTWRDAQGLAIAPPKALAVADTTSGTIVDPEGNTERPGRNVRVDRPKRASSLDGGTPDGGTPDGGT